MKREDLTQERLKEILNYDELTGIFTRMKSSGKNFRRKTGWISNFGYVNIRIDGKTRKAHRLAWLYVYGYMPNSDIDHINHDKSDNRICNLRVVDRKTNCENKGRHSKNTSGYPNVYYRKEYGNYQILFRGKYYGVCYSFDEAVKERNRLAKVLGFHDFHGFNNIDTI